METTTDTLEDVYELTDRYTPGLNRLTAGVERFGRTVRGVLSLLTNPLGLLGAGGLAAFGIGAIKASGDMEQLRITLETLTGSADTAARKLEFIRQLDIISPFTFQQLAQASTELEAFGLRTEKVLPLVAKLGGAFQADTEHLQELVRIFGETASGRFPDIRQLAAFGLSRQGLAQQGIKFDKQGTLLSSSREALEALARYIEQKYGDILDRMAGATNTKLANMEDAWLMFKVKVGDVLAKYVTPVLERLSDVLDNITQGNKVEVFIGRIGKVLKDLAEIGKIIAAVFAGIVTAQTVLDFVKLVGVISSVAMALAEAAAAAGVLEALLGNKTALVGGLLALLAGVAATYAVYRTLSGLQKNAMKALQGLSNGPTTPGKMPEGAGEGTFSNTGDDSALGALQQTARNTAVIAGNTNPLKELRRFVVGGGTLAGIGVTPVEIGRARHNFNIRVQAGSRNLEMYLQDMFTDLLVQAKRQGFI